MFGGGRLILFSYLLTLESRVVWAVCLGVWTDLCQQLPGVCWGLLWCPHALPYIHCTRCRSKVSLGSLSGCRCSSLVALDLLICSTTYCCLSPLCPSPFVRWQCWWNFLSRPWPKIAMSVLYMYFWWCCWVVYVHHIYWIAVGWVVVNRANIRVEWDHVYSFVTIGRFPGCRLRSRIPVTVVCLG